MILDALEYAHQRAVLYKGRANLGQFDLPDTVYLLDYAPHSWLFPRMAAVVHHAGAGTSAAALRAGVPSVPIPHSGDQPFWARRLYQIGAGTKPLRRNRLSAVDLAERIMSAIRDFQLRSQAADLAARISGEDSTGRTDSVFNDLFQKKDPSSLPKLYIPFKETSSCSCKIRDVSKTNTLRRDRRKKNGG